MKSNPSENENGLANNAGASSKPPLAKSTSQEASKTMSSPSYLQFVTLGLGSKRGSDHK